jgi:hypothetical protein
MSGFPSFFKQHKVIVEPYLGTDGYGRQRFGPGAEVWGMLEQTTKTVRDKDGNEVTSKSQFRCDLDTVAPPLSRVTLPDGETTSVISSARLDGGALPLPHHREIACE